MAFIWRRYTPKTNRRSLARIFSSHVPLPGKLTGIDGFRRGPPGEDAHEAHDVGSYGLIHEMILRHHPENFPAVADHDLGIEGEPARHFLVQSRPSVPGFRNDECARRADVDRIEACQFLGERGRSEGSVTADVDPSQKNHQYHYCPLTDAPPP